MSKLRIGIIGAGTRGAAYTNVIRSSADCELAGVCDINRERLESFARQFDLGGMPLCPDHRQMLAREDVPAVVIATPDSTHRELAVASFAAGKHVILEKPMATTVEDCHAILRASRQADRVVVLGFVMRAIPFYRRVKRIMDEGILGQIMGITASEYLSVEHSASFMRRWHRRKANSGGLLLSKCCHDMDVLNWLLGSLPVRAASFGGNNFFLPSKQPASHCSKCTADCPYRFRGTFVMMTEQDRLDPSRNHMDLCVYTADKDIADNQLCILEYPGGVRVSFAVQMFHVASTRHITIAGTEAYLSGCLESGKILLQHSRDDRTEEIDIRAEQEGGHCGGDEGLVRDFVLAVQTGRCPLSGLRDGLASNVVSLALQESMETGLVVNIDPKVYEV